MLKKRSINLINLILSLSDALDLVSPKLSKHQQRTAYISWRIAKAASLPHDFIEKIFIAALLHDIGALSPEEKMNLHGGFETKKPEKHCILGKILFNQVSWLKASAEIVRYHHTPWENFDKPIDSPDVLGAQILFLADTLERNIDRDKYILHQNEELILKISSLCGKTIHPEIIEYFIKASNKEEFWLDVMSHRLYSNLFHEGPHRTVEVELDDIISIAELFRNIIDFRSPFTATHSTGVARCSYEISKYFGFTQTEMTLIKVAGYLHDIGKLIVPNKILEKPDKLTKEEFATIRQHTYFSYSVINTIGGLEQIASWAAFHHEKLDGSGYPFHLKEEDISVASRIIAVADVFVALQEDRPYREGMEKTKVISILESLANNNHLDKNIINILVENHELISTIVKSEQKNVSHIYEQNIAIHE